MGYLKKIYTLLIIVTLICGTILVLNVFNAIEFKSDFLLKIVTYVPLTYVFCGLFSRNAIVAANKNNIDLSNGILAFYLICFLLIIFTSFLDIVKIPKFIITVLIYVFVFFTSLMLIYEVPATHIIHSRFQKFMVLLTIVSLILGVSYISKLENLSDFAELKNVKTHGELFLSSLIIFGTSFIINPMLRVIFYDQTESILNNNLSLYKNNKTDNVVNVENENTVNNVANHIVSKTNTFNNPQSQISNSQNSQQSTIQQSEQSQAFIQNQNFEVPSLDEFNNHLSK